jgi:hypothetical protein
VFLFILTGEAFRQRVSNYVKPKLNRGEPSLFNTLKYLYNDIEKVKIIEDVFLQFETNLLKQGHFEETGTQHTHERTHIDSYLIHVAWFNRKLSPIIDQYTFKKK